MSLNLIHLANFNSTNIGNGALIRGLEAVIEEDFPEDVHWQREPWDDYTFGFVDFDIQFVDKINHSDGLIVGGAVTFNGRDYNSRTGTRFELPLDLWDKITKPVIFYGLSYRHWENQSYFHLDKLFQTITKILSFDNMVLALRNDGTKDWLKKMIGVEDSRIKEIPDSALFVPFEDVPYYPELSDSRKNIIISLNGEDMEYRYNENYSVQGSTDYSKKNVISRLADAVQLLSDSYEINLILCPHYFDDYKMMNDFIESVNPQFAHQVIVSTGLSRVSATEFFYGRYKRCDLSISMRVHSMSPCIGLGVPMIAYTTQDRMTSFMERNDLQDYSVNAFDILEENTLCNIMKLNLENPNKIKERFLCARDSMRKEINIFNLFIYDVIRLN